MTAPVAVHVHVRRVHGCILKDSYKKLNRCTLTGGNEFKSSFPVFEAGPKGGKITDPKIRERLLPLFNLGVGVGVMEASNWFTVWGRPFGLLSGVLLKLRFVSDPQVRYQLQSPLQLNAQARNLVPNRFSPKKGKTNKAAILCAQMIHLVISVQKNTIHSSIHRLVINKLLQPKHEDTIDRQWQLLTA